jgi:hypothetical protein
MLKQLPTIAIASALFLAAATSAHAQACKNKVAIGSIYSRPTSAGHFEYIVQLVNTTKKPLSWQLDFKNLPTGVNPYKPQMTSGTSPLAPGTPTSIRIGSGTNANVSVNTVSVGFDTPGSAITVSNCK